MTSAHSHAGTEGFTPQHDMIPNPNAIAQQYDVRAKEIANTFKAQISEAQGAVDKAKAANGFFAKRRAFSMKRADIDAKYAERDKKLSQEIEALAFEVSKLSKLEKTLANGALKSAYKRAEAKSTDLQQQIDEIASLRDTIQTLKGMKLNIPKRYPHEDILGLNRVDSLEAQIKELQAQASNDPHYQEIKEKHAGLKALLEDRRAKLEQARKDKKRSNKEWSTELSALKEEIGSKTESALKSATESFNAVAHDRDEAVHSVRMRAEDVIQAEKQAYNEYRSNMRAARRERRQNLLSGIFNAARKAKDIIMKTVSEAFNKKTKGEEANEIFLEERRKKIESGFFGGPS